MNLGLKYIVRAQLLPLLSSGALASSDYDKDEALVQPGTVVRLLNKEDFSSGEKRACWGRENGSVFWSESSNFLPLRRFLKRQPLQEFWAAASKNALAMGNDDCCFLAFPNSGTITIHGSTPFRFESEGELRYWFKLRDMKLDNYLVGHFHLL